MSNNNYKITVFGDSIGKGVYTDGGKIEIMKCSAVSLFEECFGIKTDNRSGYGQSLKKLSARGIIERYIKSIDKSENNIVAIELGGNDADFNWAEVAASPNADHAPNTDIEIFSESYGEYIRLLKEMNVKVIACTIVPISSKRYFDNVISRVADKDRVMEFFNGDLDTIHRHQEMFNNEILKNSYKYGADVIDLRKRFLSSNNFEKMMCRDGIHPNALGQREIFGAVSDYITHGFSA